MPDDLAAPESAPAQSFLTTHRALHGPRPHWSSAQCFKFSPKPQPGRYLRRFRAALAKNPLRGISRRGLDIIGTAGRRAKENRRRNFHRRSLLALPIFPCSHPQSIVGANELNFCVRDGNRWTLIAINTNYMDKSFRFHRLIRSVARPVCQSALRSNSLCILARYFRSVKHFSPP